jgi:antitoxin (DNA-binding transcriptional repressor) of toxin-antitoxin stability system
MKVAGIREIRENSAAYLSGGEPFLVTKHGKISGVFVPLDLPDSIPDDWRREIGTAVRRALARLMDAGEISETKLAEDFRAYRRRRRGR